MLMQGAKSRLMASDKQNINALSLSILIEGQKSSVFLSKFISHSKPDCNFITQVSHTAEPDTLATVFTLHPKVLLPLAETEKPNSRACKYP
ncbi:MAG: hypothetical protein ACI9J2_002818 [Saprospiraceae bacterium]|jgi:hypothetical protein